ncbi:MAG: Gfo/Idh/MocA family protein [Halobacteriaceae archaeon]
MTYRAGIVGTGGVAGMGILGMHDEEKIGEEKVETSHAGGYDAAEGVELVAVADVDREKLDRFGDVWNVPEEHRYLGHEAMLEAEDLDVVSVCTPTYLHADHVVDAAELADPGVIWAEKPIASAVADGERAVEACEENGVDLVINHSSRFEPEYQALREEVQGGLLGEVKSVNAGFRMELMRNSTHLLDMLVYLLDARAERVAGYITGENEAAEALGATVELDDAGGGGFLVTDDGAFVTVDCTLPRDISTMYYHLVGTEGKLYVNPMDDEWRFWALTDDGHEERALDLPSEGHRASNFQRAAAHVVDLLDGDAENVSPGREALRSLEIIVAFYVSEYTGGQVDVPLEEPLRDVTITSW